MLKISVIDRGTECRLVLEGKLIAPWVAELRTVWGIANGQNGKSALVIDLRNVTFISQEGENVLLELMKEGAKFRCSSVLTKHVIQELARRHKRNSGKQIKCAREDQGQK